MAGASRLEEVWKACKAYLFNASGISLDQNALCTTPRPSPLTEAFLGPHMADMANSTHVLAILDCMSGVKRGSLATMTQSIH